jgi:endonuclease/exonuclease/phosphatase (EEP) superfamily protein YafD
MIKFLGHSLLSFINGVGFLVLGVSLLGFGGSYWWFFDLFSHFRVQYVEVFLLLLGISLSGGSKRLSILWLIALLINAAPVLGNLLPSDIPRSTPPPTAAKVMLFNVNSTTGNPDLVALTVFNENPEILIIQELNEKWLKALFPVLEKYPYRVFQARNDNFGIGIFSKIPYSSKEILYLGMAEVPSARMDVIVEDQPLTIFTTHPLPPVSHKHFLLRNDQLHAVAEYLRTIPNETILAGDLNISPWSPLWKNFANRSSLTDSSRGRGIFPTWPSIFPFPLIPIDHFLHSENVSIKSKRIGDPSGSDHFPVIVEFGLTRGNNE